MNVGRAWWSRVARTPARLFTSPMRDVRSVALRVALTATAMVAVLYLLIAAAVVMIVNRNLVSDVDTRLQTRLNLYVAQFSGQPPMQPGLGISGPPQRTLQEPLLTWVVYPTGGLSTFVDNVDGTYRPRGALPDSARSITSPTTFALSDGTEMRGDGVAIDGGHIIVGQSVANVVATQHNILTAEVIIGPALLLAVFFGSLAIGRRVGSPIERARQRQIELTADASHELRTPLSVIEAQTSLALERERDSTWYRNAFEAVGVESKRMRKLVDDLLWLARFDSTGPTPASEATDLGVLAEQAAQRFTAVAEARGLALHVAAEPVSTMINAPPEWLDRLLGVLLDNACRYTPPGGTVDVRVQRREGRVRLAVDDSGPGIPAAERSHIFDRFRRASDAPGGSGLGLAIAAAVVGASGGRWEVGTSPAGGASMAVSWTPLIRGSIQSDDFGALSN
ncbi:MAG: HAMP domain-containing histidine kinase, partial [Candidatus Dormibacteraeota bacterium]|nr:HAMP domain-containing histidine kinase [Candidatus Dormibacteraeota bacterium]